MRVLTDGRLQADVFERQTQTVTFPSNLRQISLKISVFCKTNFVYSGIYVYSQSSHDQGSRLTVFPGTPGDTCVLSYRSGWSCGL